MKQFRAPAVSFLLLVIVLALLTFLANCGGLGSGNSNKPGSSGALSVTVAPPSVSVAAGTAFSAFVATVTGTTNSSVTWMVDNVPGGNSTTGTIDSSGHYQAPSVPGNHTVSAVSMADPSKSGSSQVTVTAAFSVSISPASATVAAKATQQFTATVTPIPNLGVAWSVDGVAGGNASVGTIDGNGLYTAPATSGTHTITATSKDTPTSTASAQVTIPAGLSINPAAARMAVNASQQFVVTPTDPSLLPVTWSVDGQAGGSSASGTISSTGLYTAPAAAGTHTITAASVANNALSATAQATIVVPDFGSVSMLTYHNDGQRTGLNPNETILNPSNVNASTFGKQFSYPVDGQVYAQPLFVSSLTNISSGTHNVVFVATEHNSVYAFDADGLSPNALWQKNLGPSVPSKTVEGVSVEKGITGTPVIDGTTDTLYVVAETQGGIFKLHALDLHDGSEKFGGPVQVTATVAGTGFDNVNGSITLEHSCLQRPGLALVNGIVFVAFGACPHGWLMGYNAASLQQVSKINTTPNGGGGALWMGGGAPATDGLGNLYVMTAVDFGDPAPGFNDTFLKLNAADLSVLDSFTPSNEAFLRANDADLGSGGPLILPDNASAHPHEVVGGGKDGRVFVLDRDHMGGFNAPSNPACDNTSTPPTTCDNVVQTIPDIGNAQFDNIFSTPAYFNGLVYFHPQTATLQAFQYSNGTLARVASASTTFGDHGATPSVSANGTSGGIVWELQTDAWSTNGPAILHASDAANVTNELYNSSQAAGGRDTAGPAVKFTTPMIANGRVYVGTGNQLDVYGLLTH
ncbi:MAG TPA: Ig-like domain-containing protein [Candidatus Angelobacter sp.]